MSIWLSNIDSEVKDEDGCWGWGEGGLPTDHGLHDEGASPEDSNLL